MKKEQSIWKFTRKIPGERMSPAEGEATVCGALVTTDDATGLATAIDPIRVGRKFRQRLGGVN
jgi:2',3'-cyclic-nucleotide 2'-phosphodiesterase